MRGGKPLAASGVMLIVFDVLLIAVAGAGCLHEFFLRPDVARWIPPALIGGAAAGMFLRTRTGQALAAVILLTGAALSGLMAAFCVLGVLLLSMGGSPKPVAGAAADGTVWFFLGLSALGAGLTHMFATRRVREPVGFLVVQEGMIADAVPAEPKASGKAGRWALAAKVLFGAGVALGMGALWVGNRTGMNTVALLWCAGGLLAGAVPLAIVALVMGAD